MVENKVDFAAYKQEKTIAPTTFYTHYGKWLNNHDEKKQSPYPKGLRGEAA